MRGLWGWLPGSRRDDEQALLTSARAGRAVAFEALRERHQEAITDFCRMMLEARGEEAAAVTEEIFAAARRELPSMPRGVSIGSWFYALAYERCVARLGDDETYPGTAARAAQGDESDQRRGAALLVGSLSDAELASIVSLAAMRPALFGVAGAVARSAPNVVATFAVELASEQAATEAVAALAQSTFADDSDEAARSATRAPVVANDGEAAAGRRADRIRRAATTAAVTGSIAVVAGAGVYAVAESQRSSDSAGVASPAGEGGPTQARGAQPTVTTGTAGTTGAGAGSTGASGERGGRGRTTVIRLPRGSGAGGRQGLGGRDGRGGAQGAAGSPGGVVRDPSRFLPPAGGGGGGQGGTAPGGGTPAPPGGSDPLVRVDARVGPVRAQVDVPSP